MLESSKGAESSKSAVELEELMEQISGILDLQPEESDVPEISIDVSKLDSTINDEIDKPEPSKDEPTNVNPTTYDNVPNEEVINKSKNNFVWVSNIPRNIKAAELKKFFSQIGKVGAVKILTNGKNFYGYVSMDNPDLATKCISDLNDSLFCNQKLIISRKRPDLVDLKIKKKTPSKKPIKKDDTDIKVDNIVKVNNDTSDENKKKKLENNRSKEHKSHRSDDKKIDSQEKQKLQSKIDSLNFANKKLKNRLEEFQRLYDGMCRKYKDLREELDKVKFENRDERRRLNQEKEFFEKTKKLELSRIEADKSLTNKELSEAKKLKDSLKQKLNDIRFDSKKSLKRDRSPNNRTKSPRRRPTSATRNGSFYNRDDQRPEKKYRHEFSRDRTPPPPNLNSDIPKKRNESNNISSTRPYFHQNNKPQSNASFDYRQNRTFTQCTSQRSPWMGHQRNLRRNNSDEIQSNNQSQRFNGGVSIDSHPSSAIVVPPRAPHGSYYYPQW